MSGPIGTNNIGSMSSGSHWTSFGGGFQNDSAGGGDVTAVQLNGGCEENPESRKMPPRPIGVERAWKQQAAGHPGPEEWMAYQPFTSPHQPPPPSHQHPHPLIHQQPYEDMNMDRYPPVCL